MLQENRWSVIATAHTGRGGFRRWIFVEGFDDRDTRAAAAREAILMMQRRVGLELQLVARLPPPAWKRVQHWRMRHPLILTHMRVP